MVWLLGGPSQCTGTRPAHLKAALMKAILKSGLRMLGYQVRRHVDPAAEVPAHHRGLQRICNGSANPTIFDVGAHHGETEQLLRKLLPSATIHCFEPFPSSFAVLEQSLSGGSYAHNFGFAENSGQKSFQANAMDVTNSLLPLETSAPSTWELGSLRPEGQIECRFETIDNFMQDKVIAQIDLLKIDTQGAEYLVLEGARNALDSRSIKNVYLEIITAQTYVGQKDFAFYVDFFDRAGFKLYGLYDTWHNTNGELLQLDALFTLK